MTMQRRSNRCGPRGVVWARVRCAALRPGMAAVDRENGRGLSCLAKRQRHAKLAAGGTRSHDKNKGARCSRSGRNDRTDLPML